MPKCRVAKGGWSWQGETMTVGAVLEAPSEQWIDNRINDGGLVERVEDGPASEPVIESATDEPVAETAVSPRQRARRAKS